MKYLSDIPRHAIFGDASDLNKMYIVPEGEVRLELTKKSEGVEMIAKFNGQRVTLPRGSAVQFVQLQAITATGGIGFSEAAPSAEVSRLHIPGARN